MKFEAHGLSWTLKTILCFTAPIALLIIILRRIVGPEYAAHSQDSEHGELLDNVSHCSETYGTGTYPSPPVYMATSVY